MPEKSSPSIANSLDKSLPIAAPLFPKPGGCGSSCVSLPLGSPDRDWGEVPLAHICTPACHTPFASLPNSHREKVENGAVWPDGTGPSVQDETDIHDGASNITSFCLIYFNISDIQ